MNKKIILGLTATALLASSLLAFNGQGQMQQGKKIECNKQGKMMKGQAHHNGKHTFIKMVMKLDLTPEQRTKVVAIVKKSKTGMPNPHDAFTDTAFDKKEFIKLAKERRDGRIEVRADMIEKIYTVLNSAQKKDLKTMLDMRDIMKKNRMKKGMNCNAKNCNGRR
ncbi:Spy/CpxP family protein refolding chaperone [Sulfurimonas sp. CS5]|jgi:Spy/CpxP family protein refolding chaperone|uniref:Spy/CpxP family protein refolding chaperone n=1 Tax=Sulfurimonas sp. CS5 TaxID=3391145 RepID=UPI0039EBDD4B